MTITRVQDKSPRCSSQVILLIFVTYSKHNGWIKFVFIFFAFCNRRITVQLTPSSIFYGFYAIKKLKNYYLLHHEGIYYIVSNLLGNVKLTFIVVFLF